jgi:Baseplate J-like protein
MANEQIIYVGPEEELTNVRERLEHTQAGRILLVIPPQTQLRSHVGWRLLRSRVRELGQDVLVISSDRQIRAVAKAAGFRVADSLESPPSDRPRPNNRPVRSDMGGKTSQGSGKQVGSGRPDSRSLRPGQQPNKRNLPTKGRQQPPVSSSSKGGTINDSGEMNTGIGATASSTFEIEDIQFDSHYPLPNETVPPGRSVAAGREDDEIDPLVVDYYVARSIREAAQGADADATPSPSEMTRPSSGKPEQSSKIPPPSGIDDDPFAYMEDIQPVALPEQRASTFIHDIDQGIPDISDIPTDVHEVEIEDLGDEEEVMLQHDLSPRALAEPMQETPQIYSKPPHISRMGSNARPLFENIEDEDELLPVPIPDQPTRVTPSSPARSSGVPAKRGPQPIIQPPPQARNVSIKPAVQQTRKPPSTKTSRTVTKPPMSRGTGTRSNHRGRRITIIVVSSLALLLIAVLAFLFVGSNATVTIVVPSQSLSVTRPYVASTNQHNTQPNTIPSQVLTYTASATGQGAATGTVQQGNQVATGTVTFSNKSSLPVDIPTGTLLSTSGAVAIQFVTTADALVQPDSSSNLPSVVPVQAQLPGDSGNVAANSITIIPPDSITKIAGNNQISSTSVNLTVTNLNPTTGGGAANVQAVTLSDKNTLELALQQKVQNEINGWLTNLKNQRDEVGTPMPNVLASPTPLPEEKVKITPDVGQYAPGGKFIGTLTVNVSVLVIRNAAIQAAGKAQLMAKALHQNPPYVLATPLPAVNVTKRTPTQDGTTLSITVDATGLVMQQVPAQQLSQQLAGKNVDQAKSFVKSGQAGIKGVVDTSIDVFPPFLGYMPFRPVQIHIIVQPGPVKGTPNG